MSFPVIGAEMAWLLPALCIAAFIIVTFWGRYLPGKGAYITIAAIGAGFVLFWFILRDLLFNGPQFPNFTWFEVATYQLKVGMIVDPLSVLMLGLVTLVSLGVQIYSLGYMHGDPRFGWYFAAHSLFAAAMLGLVLADNFLMLYITWELVGLCSYLLIGFWYERRSAAEAAKKAFITTRLGDVGLLIGILILFKATGTFDIRQIIEAVEGGQVAAGTLTLATILIFLGAMGKSAQFPFHVWLPDAMEGPTPVSALIHAATMVAAGVFLVARSFPIFAAAPGTLQVVTTIGLITVLLASTMALVMRDIKRVLAYSTISHLGFMMVGLGSLGVTAGMFHLMSHAVSKALLFLGAGSVIHSLGKQDITEMGGLWRRLPITTITFVIGALSLAGLFPLGGFWSKDEVLTVIRDNQHPVLFFLALIAALMSALYIARLLFVVFFGELKRENSKAHESPRVMLLPLVVLGTLAALIGFLALPWVGSTFGLPSQYTGFGSFVFGHEPEEFHLDLTLAGTSIVITLLGLFIGWAIYSRRIISSETITSRFAGLHRLVLNRYYIDDIYQWITDRILLGFSGLVALFDRMVVNDTGVNGSASIPVLMGEKLRYHQTGRVYNYALAITVGIVVITILTATLVI